MTNDQEAIIRFQIGENKYEVILRYNPTEDFVDESGLDELAEAVTEEDIFDAVSDYVDSFAELLLTRVSMG